jgi:dTDP-3-amino-3,4,6-trideoxy-alpha-D-glucose transaminase
VTSVEVPFLDLASAQRALKAKILADISSLIDSARFVNGPQVSRFEQAFSSYCGTAECVGVASGLDGLRLALLAAGLEPGEEVIVPAHTFVATLEAVTQAGGKPILVDVSESDYNIDVAAVEAAVSSRTRFLVPVHLYGQMADLSALSRLAKRFGLEIIEDACQAHGAERDGLRAGTVGVAGAFSFYPAKNLGAFGDAGAVVTSDPEVARRVRALREHGQTAKYRHELEGWTARLDAIQAIVLVHKLPLLNGWNDQRRAAADFYSDALHGVGDVRLPPVPVNSKPVWHLYVIRTEKPNALADFLLERGVSTGRHYPHPPHLTPAYARLGLDAGSFPVTEQLAEQCLSLPVYPGISEAQLAACVEAVTEFFANG